MQSIAAEHNTPMTYVNLVGGQDALLFDGGSMLISHDGNIINIADDFAEHILYGTLTKNGITSPQQHKPDSKNVYQELINAISMGIKSYVHKNQFNKGVIIALSGGIDSAVTLALAVNALGADKVEAVYMPSKYNASISEIDAKLQADKLGVTFHILPIEKLAADYNQLLGPLFTDYKADVTEENLQARIRGVLLMALSNKFHKLVLTTGNKSEYAVGYATLYGDMCGGYAPIKDLYKTQVYQLAHALNERGLFIPDRVITREPSAELSENQLDQNTLPPYDVLDTILQLFIEEDMSAEDIHQQTQYDKSTIERVITMVLRNEYKRQQSAPGPRVSKRAFGKDRRYPISAQY